MATRFDPIHSVEFDFGRGQIAVRGGSERVLIPADALAALCQGAEPEVRKDFARRLGSEAGRRAAERLGDPARAEIEEVIDHLGGDFALMGFGSLGLERWGRALVFTVVSSPFGKGGDELVACMLEGAVQRAFGRDVGVAVLQRDDTLVRFLVTSRLGADRVREWLDNGIPWSEALGRLETAPQGQS